MSVRQSLFPSDPRVDVIRLRRELKNETAASYDAIARLHNSQ